MDEMALLRAMDDEAAPLTSAARAKARGRLTAEINRPGRRRPRRPSPRAQRVAWRVGFAVAGAAAVLAAGIVIPADDVPPGAKPLGLDNVSAAEVLTHAAEVSRAEDSGMVTPRGDQFVYSKEILEERPVGEDGPVESFTDEDWASVDGTKTDRASERGSSSDIEPLRPDEATFPPDTYAGLQALPDDPDRLMIAARDFGGKIDYARPMTEDDYDRTFPSVAALLHSWPMMPKGMRATIFEAMSRAPDVELLDHQLDARGRSGIAVVRENGNFMYTLTTTIIIDAETYEYLGMRAVLEKEDGTEVDQITSLVEVGVVDRLGERP